MPSWSPTKQLDFERMYCTIIFSWLFQCTRRRKRFVLQTERKKEGFFPTHYFHTCTVLDLCTAQTKPFPNIVDLIDPTSG